MAYTSTYSLFKDSKYYKDHAYPETGAPPIDLAYDKVLYGRVDEQQNGIFLKKPYSYLGNVRSYLGELQGNKEESILALDFVADAFNKLFNHYDKAMISKNIRSAEESVITELKPTSGWLSFDLLYEANLNNVFETYSVYLFNTGKEKKVRGLSDYVKFFEEFIVQLPFQLSVTSESFVKSKLCSPAVSGLMIELGDNLDHTNEDHKRQWISDPNFNFYRNAALMHGFRIDKNAPWRLVADVSSVEMQMFMNPIIDLSGDGESKEQVPQHWNPGEGEQSPSSLRFFDADTYSDTPNYGLEFKPGAASNLFDIYYNRAWESDFFKLWSNLIKYYNKFAVDYPTSKLLDVSKVDPRSGRSCNFSKLRKTVFKRHPVSLSVWAKIKQKARRDFWKTYFNIRLKEEGVGLEPQQVDNYMKVVLHDYFRFNFDLSDFVYNSGMRHLTAWKYLQALILRIKSQKVYKKTCQSYEKCAIVKQEIKPLAVDEVVTPKIQVMTPVATPKGGTVY